jgi:hypothetical protein
MGKGPDEHATDERSEKKEGNANELSSDKISVSSSSFVTNKASAGKITPQDLEKLKKVWLMNMAIEKARLA